MASQGRRSAMLSVVLLLVSAAAAAQATTWTVGDSAGWKIPTTGGTTATYLSDWTKNKTFAVGDTVLFEYAVGAHSVLTVTAAAYDACTLTSPLLTSTSGNDSLLLSAGSNYYICGIPGHCVGGQKVVINATAAPGTPLSAPGTPLSAPPPPGTPAAPAPPGSDAAGNAVTVSQVLAAVMVSLVGSLALW